MNTLYHLKTISRYYPGAPVDMGTCPQQFLQPSYWTLFQRFSNQVLKAKGAPATYDSIRHFWWYSMSTSQDGFGLVDCKLNCIENVDPATTTTVSTTQSTTTTIENRGAFNNYLDEILPNFDHLLTLQVDNCGQLRTFYILPILCPCD